MIKLEGYYRGGDMNKKNILSYSYENLEKELIELGFKKFNAKQIFEWLHKKIIRKFDEMTNISLKQRELIKETYYIPYLELKSQKTEGNKDFYYFELEDGIVIETALEKNGEKVIMHLSSQSQNPEATTLLGVNSGSVRNLELDEILNQVYTLYRRLRNKGEEINNINFSCFGEPFFNFDNVLNAIETISSETGLNISKRKFILTTAGVIPGIDKLMETRVPLELHVKLHSVVEEKRDILLSVNKSYPLEDLHATLSAYQKGNKRRITFEYTLIKDFNSTSEDLEILGNFVHDFDHNLVIYPFVTVEGFEYEPPHFKKVERIYNYFKNERNTNVFLKD